MTRPIPWIPLLVALVVATGCPKDELPVEPVPPTVEPPPPPEGLLPVWDLPEGPLPDPRGRPPLAVALEVLDRDPRILAFERDFLERDPFRLDIVQRALDDPMAGLGLLDAAPTALDPGRRLAWVRDLLGLPARMAPPRPARVAPAVGPRMIRAAAFEDSGWLQTPGLVDGLAALLGPFVDQVEHAADLAARATEDVEPADRKRILRHLHLFPGRAGDEARAIEAALRSVQPGPMLEAGETLLEATLALADRLTRLDLVAGSRDLWWPPLEIETAIGRVVVGGPADDLHTGGAAVVLDLGGNDLYLDVEAGSAPVLAILDLRGADVYRSDGPGSAGTGFLGASVSVDLSGDDLYSTSGPGPAAAIGGVGILLDASGNDLYTSGRMGQGAAIAGVALLLDEIGDDRYEATSFGQGFGGPAGVGVLLDGGGDDRYVAGLVHADHREEVVAHVAFAQGYGMGNRDVSSGGVGWLEDLSGDDTYLGSYFGQGAAYWYALGVLVDRGGQDRYVARRYSQGAGVHAAIGLLDDRSGRRPVPGRFRGLPGLRPRPRGGDPPRWRGRRSLRGRLAQPGSGKRQRGGACSSTSPATTCTGRPTRSRRAGRASRAGPSAWASSSTAAGTTCSTGRPGRRSGSTASSGWGSTATARSRDLGDRSASRPETAPDGTGEKRRAPEGARHLSPCCREPGPEAAGEGGARGRGCQDWGVLNVGVAAPGPVLGIV